MFNVQRRMADYAFEQATTWDALLAAHAAWVADYNYQEHFAHQHREDTKRSPAHVLSGMRGTIYGAAELHYLFHALRFRRHLDRHGYLRFRHWRIYAEAGLARDGVDVWLYDEHLTVVFEDLTLAKYHVSYQPDGRRLRTIDEPQLYQTPHQSPQLPLWVLKDDEWRKAYRLPLYAVRRRLCTDSQIVQEPLPLDLDLAG
jgi:putative transposase